jgi:hypothetical protein
MSALTSYVRVPDGNGLHDFLISGEEICINARATDGHQSGGAKRLAQNLGSTQSVLVAAWLSAK